jgi:hypothetical protein
MLKRIVLAAVFVIGLAAPMMMAPAKAAPQGPPQACQPDAVTFCTEVKAIAYEICTTNNAPDNPRDCTAAALDAYNKCLAACGRIH